MRLSVTDRCNLRCRYCMPTGIEKIAMTGILTYEQLHEICEAGVECGITRFKVTGGEPLVRLGVTDFIRNINDIPGVEKVTLTTNGVLLAPMAEDLAKAGVDCINVSLDTLRHDRYKEITGFDKLDETLAGMKAALDAGVRVKTNTVLQRGENEDEWEDLVMLAKDMPVDVRFIEMMPIGFGREFDPVYNDDMLERIRDRWPGVEEDLTYHGNGPAVYVSIPGFKGSVGFISAMHGKFCDTCNRLRLSSTGKLKPCLCFGDTVDLMDVLKEEDPAKRKEGLILAIKKAIEIKPGEHRFENPSDITEDREMIDIGG